MFTALVRSMAQESLTFALSWGGKGPLMTGTEAAEAPRTIYPQLAGSTVQMSKTTAKAIAAAIANFGATPAGANLKAHTHDGKRLHKSGPVLRATFDF
jgi:hypothetical protein